MLREMKITDIHIHGIGGYDTRTSDERHILKIAEIQGSYGVSDILLTVYPSSVQEMRRCMDTIRKAMEIQRSSEYGDQAPSCNRDLSMAGPSPGFSSDKHRPATISGIHLEGPFLNPIKCGALNPEACSKPTGYAFEELTEGFIDIVRIITIAPEIPGAPSLIKKISALGIVVSMGHSDATFAEAEEGFLAGAKGITHIFNAMRSFHHRELGIAGFGLLTQGIYIEIIADPFHLHKQVIDLIFKIKNPERIIIISDSVKETDRTIRSSAITDIRGNLLGGSMPVTVSAERLVKQGYDKDAIMKCITENPLAYLSSLR